MKLETEILLNRFRCTAEIARLSNVREQQNDREEDRGRSADHYKDALEEIERRVAEVLERHRALWAQKR